MALSIPTSEPSELRAGDTWQWRREDLCDFPASVWTLTYYFRNAAAFFDVVADADGDQFAVDVAKATTASQATGYYDWTAAVANGTERREIGRGSVVVLPDFSTAAVLDTRSNAKKLLDLVEAALLNRATTDQLDVVTSALGDRSLSRSDGGLVKLRMQLINEVKREELIAQKRNGGPDTSRLMVRFSNV
ncbi:MAG: hypothetical protein KBH41_17685 [Azonexus sp.]|nr:hypothetical protein [Azonexus sp.]